MTVYLAISVISFLMILPVAPFAHKMHRSLFYVVFVVFLGTGAYNLLAFPFSPDSALKIFYQQTIDLNSGVNRVSIIGASSYVKNYLVPEMPSAWSQDVVASDDPLLSLEDVGVVRGGRPVLAGVTAEQMADELAANADRWRFDRAVGGLARVPLLVLTSDDGLAPQADALVGAVRAAGNARVTTLHAATDHAWSDRRIALEAAVIDWLQTLAR